MCRVLVRRFNNHRFGIASRAERPTLWQAGDVQEVFEDGVSFGKKMEVSPKFYIFELLGVPSKKMIALLEQPDTARRLWQIDLARLRTKLTLKETSQMNAGKTTLVDGKRKLNQSTITRLI